MSPTTTLAASAGFSRSHCTPSSTSAGVGRYDGMPILPSSRSIMAARSLDGSTDRSDRQRLACAGKVLFPNEVVDVALLLEYCTQHSRRGVAQEIGREMRCRRAGLLCLVQLDPSAFCLELRMGAALVTRGRRTGPPLRGPFERAWNAVDRREMADRNHGPAVASDTNSAARIGPRGFKGVNSPMRLDERP